MGEKIKLKPVIIGMVGDSGVGKTTLSKGISKILGENNVAVICTDDYHMYSREERAANGMCPLDPAGNFMDIMEQHLKLLCRGFPVLKPIYNHNHGTLDRPEYVAPDKPYIIVEGLLGYSTKTMRDCYDIKVYLDPEEDLRLAWKIHRDQTKRGYTKQQVLDDLKKRAYYSETFIRPQRMYADIVVNIHGYDSNRVIAEQHLSVNNILRPTLPHPNINEHINEELGEDILFGLMRDRDNKPVDKLEILPQITETHFAKLTDLLWSGIDYDIESIKNNAVQHINSREDFSLPTGAVHIMLAAQMVKASLDLRVV